MSEDFTKSFLTYYVRSLAERTRAEKKGTKYGFDWIIYNLALAADLSPYRLPFFRAGADQISKTKTEAEFGVDLSFISRDGKALTIFVLKDEPLTNATWTEKGFDGDIRRAAAPDLTPDEFSQVERVAVVLAYNKDEDQNGIQLYENLTKSLGTRIADSVQLSFERWNLTVLTEKVREKLLTPTLLPQQFFSLFSYLCSQFADFRHGSDEWSKQLVPNWRRFLDDLLNEQSDERAIRLVPVSLLVLRQYGASNQSSETGWLDLIEWAMLAAWRVYRSTNKPLVREAVFEMWISFYLVEVERYYVAHNEALATEHSLEVVRTGSYVDAISAAVVAFWHIARLGLLGLTFVEFLPKHTDEEKARRTQALQRVANWLVALINANPAAHRPLVDLHHVELFLIWRTLWQVGRREDIANWLDHLESNLFVRRAGAVPIPFIEGRNSLELVFEHVATGQRPPEFCDQSSFLLLFLLELSFCLDPSTRDDLVKRYYQQLVLARTGDGEQMPKAQPLDLLGWIPPEDWAEKVLTKSLADEGESQTVETLGEQAVIDGSEIAAHLAEFVRQSRAVQQPKFPTDLPIAVVILACLKLRSPIPPELWRISVFGNVHQGS